tara:strand:- start:608 stop:943 length:336 start_codon:yes stop_codon:yes gene_type:complete
MSSPPNKPIDVADIRHTKPIVPEPDEKARLEMAAYDHQFRTQQAELGVIGKFLGCNAEKPGNISFIAIIVSFIIIAVSAIWAQEYFEKILSTFASVITLALGYLFGSHKKD